jgi:hypothetical protein
MSMKRLTAPYIENLNIAAAGIADGNRVLMETEANGGEGARQARMYAGQVIAEAFTQIRAAARRYMSELEYANPGASQPILGDAALQAAAVECADLLDKVVPTVGIAAGRVAAGLRAWVVDRAPREAAGLVVSCEAAKNISKTMSARAA